MMWVAEGFLRQGDDQSPEEVAERCVEELSDRSLILMSKKTFEGKIKAFRVHDLLLDFCLKEAKDEKFLQVTQSPAEGLYFKTSSASERRISIHGGEEFSRDYFDSISSTSYVRSFVCEGHQGSISLTNLFLRFKLLRVLDVAEVWSVEFPPQVLELLNLRYLALFCLEDIPASITKLWNLQTLIISGHSRRLHRENSLPVEIWMMVHLRHVRFDGLLLLDPSDAKFNFHKKHIILEDLQTLSGLLNLRFSMEVLRSIPDVKKIYVVYSFIGLMVNGWSYYQIENLGNLHHLKALKIRERENDTRWSWNLTPPSFQFPPSLKSLTLARVGIPWRDLAIIGSLPNLEVLKLKDLACIGTEWEPNEEEFPELKVLLLENLDLKHWKADSNHFPSLERLIIRWCHSLIEIPSGLGESPTLTTIELLGCIDSVRASANEIKQMQLSYGNDSFQVINANPKIRNFLDSLRTAFAWRKLSK